MVQIPENAYKPSDLIEWDTAKKELAAWKAKEALLRSKIFKHFFPNPVEGTNTAPLSQGWVLKATYPITRDVDIGAFKAAKEVFAENKINGDSLVEFKPSLKKSIYNHLTAEQKTVFDQVLIIKPGSPQMEIVLPKSAQKTEEV